MSQLSALGSRQPVAALLPPAPPRDGVAASRSGGGSTPVLDPVALSQDGIKLARDSLAKRTEQLGASTVDFAQDFLTQFARQYLGDAGKGATFSLDSASIDTSASFAGSLSHTEGANGVSDSASFDFSESAHFIGRGQITTADGQRFDVEIEVQYDLSVQGQASQLAAPPPPPPASDGAAPRKLGQLSFGGGLNDLLGLLGKTLQATAPPSHDNDDKSGNLTLKLLKLVASKTPLDAPQDNPQLQSQARAKALADTYGANA